MADPGGINPKTGRLRVNISAASDAPSPPAGFTVDPIVAPTLSWKPRPMLEPANDRAAAAAETIRPEDVRSEEHTSELQSLMRISYAVFCLKKKTQDNIKSNTQLPNIAQNSLEYTKSPYS